MSRHGGTVTCAPVCPKSPIDGCVPIGKRSHSLCCSNSRFAKMYSVSGMVGELSVLTLIELVCMATLSRHESLFPWLDSLVPSKLSL